MKSLGFFSCWLNTTSTLKTSLWALKNIFDISWAYQLVLQKYWYISNNIHPLCTQQHNLITKTTKPLKIKSFKSLEIHVCLLPPMVLSWNSWNWPLTKRSTKLDLPTADSPSSTSLNWQILFATAAPLGLVAPPPRPAIDRDRDRDGDCCGWDGLRRTETAG